LNCIAKEILHKQKFFIRIVLRENYKKKHAELLAPYALTFHDPHQGQGGLGASSAQFLMLYCLIKQLEIWRPFVGLRKLSPTYVLDKSALQALLSCYQSLSGHKSGLAPSGADLIAQYQGQLSTFHKNTFQKNILRTSSQDWPFPNVGFCLIRSGHKIATHEHLSDLAPFPTTPFADCVERAQYALQQADAIRFADCVNAYHDLMQTHNFVITETRLLVDKLRQQTGVLASKGCGALGADIILVLLQQKYKRPFINWLEEEGLKLVADETQLSAGMRAIGN